MSAAMMRGRGKSGYRIISTVTPMAPAPTEVSVTSVPIKAPKSSGNSQCLGVAARRSWPTATDTGLVFPRTALYKVAAAVSSKAPPKVVVITA